MTSGGSDQKLWCSLVERRPELVLFHQKFWFLGRPEVVVTSGGSDQKFWSLPPELLVEKHKLLSSQMQETGWESMGKPEVVVTSGGRENHNLWWNRPEVLVENKWGNHKFWWKINGKTTTCGGTSMGKPEVVVQCRCTCSHRFSEPRQCQDVARDPLRPPRQRPESVPTAFRGVHVHREGGGGPNLSAPLNLR